MTPKIIAYYLPQYHEIPENDEWWGKGFTEWTNVRRATPLFKGHVQPKVPLNRNYYDLMNKETVEWQTKLANDYGIYGFCYFHYWFKDGRKILEKPAENLLRWKDIPQRFCFFWANTQWQRTWSNTSVSGTVWVSRDNPPRGDDKSVLLEQSYGDEEQWRRHFEYFLPFFKDNRYIKIDNEPFLAIYETRSIPHAKEMFALWNRMAKSEGFDGIHLLSVNEDCFDIPGIKGVIRYGGNPVETTGTFRRSLFFRACIHHGLRLLGIENRIYNVWEYKFMWRCLLRVKPLGKGKNYIGVSVHDDDTPRRGARALIYKNVSAKVFRRNLVKLMKRGERVFGTDLLFIDAWNEWGEGNYLEPDEQYGYDFLEAIRSALSEMNENAKR